jgi:hypothetical protein
LILEERLKAIDQDEKDAEPWEKVKDASSSRQNGHQGEG